MNARHLLLLACLMGSLSALNAQDWPHQWTMDPAEHTLRIGGVPHEGLYDDGVIRAFMLNIDSPDYWQTMEDNYFDNGEAILASLTVDGSIFDSIGVRFKGQTSFFQNPTEKKSFDLSMDEYDGGGDLMGYKTINLACGFGDPTFLREFVFQHLIREHIPAAESNYIRLYINGENWGVYTNVQQTNKDFLKAWFLDTDGARWRADAPSVGGGPGGGGPPQWGDGTAALNWLGSDTADYQAYYTLKSSNILDPWDVLVNTCDVLENTPLSTLPEALDPIFDIDRTLWHLACENLFSDDDSYIHKGKMDYHVYYEEATGRAVTLEYDGNSVMADAHVGWDPFYHADEENYPLLYRLLQVPEMRQRYLAHYRVIVDQLLDPVQTGALIEQFADFIDIEVVTDPKKIYTYDDFVNGSQGLVDWISDRRDVVLAHPEMGADSPIISNVSMTSSAGEWGAPDLNETVTVSASASMPSFSPVAGMNLYYSLSPSGAFTSVPMALGSGGNYSADIPGTFSGVTVRFYLEAIAGDSPGTRSFEPVGAEHHTYYYTVALIPSSSNTIVVNELMARNDNTAADEQGQFEDWIELYNVTAGAIDLTGWHLSDNEFNIQKWPLPAGTILAPNSYLVIWADEDGSQGPFHANFKLSGVGEVVFLSNAAGEIADQVLFGEQTIDQGFARMPNGTGDFVIQGPTFGYNNEGMSVADPVQLRPFDLKLYPNPTHSSVTADLPLGICHLEVFALDGRLVFEDTRCPGGQVLLDVRSLEPNIYLVRAASDGMLLSGRLIVN